MEAVESRMLLSTLNVLGNGVQITARSTSVSASNLTDLGATDVNYLSKTATYVITDPDLTKSLNLTGTTPVTITGNDASDFSVAAQPTSDTIAANGGSTTFTIGFDAEGIGDRNATICIASDDTASSGNFTFAIEGESMPAIDLGNATAGSMVSIEPGNTPSTSNFTDFGYTDMGDDNFAVTRSFLIEDSGTSAVNLTGSPAVTIGGMGAADFKVTTQPAINTVDGTNPTPFTITFAPLAGDSGLRSATVTIDNNGVSQPFTFNIQGTALATVPAANGYLTQYATLVAGTPGTASAAGDNIVVNYTGYLLDGTTFDRSLNPGRTPFNFLLGPDSSNNNQDDVIMGWEEGTLNLNVGEQRVLLIPASEAYGATGSPGAIPPDSDLIFVVQRLQQFEILNDTSADDTPGSYIYPGSTTATTTNETDFGTVAWRSGATNTFDITAQNSPPSISAGNATAGFQITISGPDASEFSTSGIQTGTDANSDSYTYFTVTFTPGNTTGVQQATVNFDYNMISQANVTTPFAYTFAVQGTVQTRMVFGNLSVSSSVPQGTASVTLSGSIAAGTELPASGEIVAITMNSVTHDATIDSHGNFSAAFDTSQLPASNTPYQVVYYYPGDGNFSSLTDNTTTTLLVMPTNGTEVPVYRLFSPVTKEHLYTSDTNECTTDMSRGWLQDAGATSLTTFNPSYPLFYWYTGQVTTGNATAVPMYRLDDYGIAVPQHLWTIDPNEYNTVRQWAGWSVDGVVGYVFPVNDSTASSVAGVPNSEALYRLTYPFLTDVHLWTTDQNEVSALTSQDGWIQEGGVICYVLDA